MKQVMAARVAAELKQDENVQVETVRGGLGEFSVRLDGREVVKTNPLWYPSGGNVVREVRSLLAAE